ncbi:hypothetical protein ILFOPFJJ_03782 [Ensifer psoraleae]|nr:hypothetical protein [Sinorhizobium psoraleae]
MQNQPDVGTGISTSHAAGAESPALTPAPVVNGSKRNHIPSDWRTGARCRQRRGGKLATPPPHAEYQVSRRAMEIGFSLLKNPLRNRSF